MSLDLTLGGHHHLDEGDPDWLAELDAALIALGQPPHVEPDAPLAAWSVKRRVEPLAAAAASTGTWRVLTRFHLNDAVFLPGDRPPHQRAPTGLSVASVDVLIEELTALIAQLDPEDAASEAAHLFLHAAQAARDAGCALWLR